MFCRLYHIGTVKHVTIIHNKSNDNNVRKSTAVPMFFLDYFF